MVRRVCRDALLRGHRVNHVLYRHEVDDLLAVLFDLFVVSRFLVDDIEYPVALLALQIVHAVLKEIVAVVLCGLTEFLVDQIYVLSPVIRAERIDYRQRFKLLAPGIRSVIFTCLSVVKLEYVSPACIREDHISVVKQRLCRAHLEHRQLLRSGYPDLEVMFLSSRLDLDHDVPSDRCQRDSFVVLQAELYHAPILYILCVSFHRDRYVLSL